MKSAIEMHIAVRQGLEKIDSFQDEHFFADEIDLQLNRSQDRFIEDLIDNFNEDKQVRLSYVSNLITRNKKLDAIISESTDSDYQANSVYSILPSDYKYLLNSRSNTYRDTTYPGCETLLSSSISTSTYTEYIAIVPWPEPSSAFNNLYFHRPRIEVDSVDIYRAPISIGTFSELTSKFVIINNIIESINRDSTLPYEVYWEQYRDIYYQNTFIFVSNDASVDTDVVRAIVYEDDTTTEDVATSDTFSSTDYLVYNPSSSLLSNQYPNRILESEESYNFQARTNKFYGTKYYEPIGILDDKLSIFYNESFIVRDITIDYIRNPRQISLALDQSCEMSNAGARRIVDLTIEYFKLVIENPSYQAFTQDNNLRNQIN